MYQHGDIFMPKKIDNSEDYIRCCFTQNQNFHVNPIEHRLPPGKPSHVCLIHWIDDDTHSRLYRNFSGRLMRDRVITDIHVVRALRSAFNF